MMHITDYHSAFMFSWVVQCICRMYEAIMDPRTTLYKLLFMIRIFVQGNCHASMAAAPATYSSASWRSGIVAKPGRSGGVSASF